MSVTIVIPAAGNVVPSVVNGVAQAAMRNPYAAATIGVCVLGAAALTYSNALTTSTEERKTEARWAWSKFKEAVADWTAEPNPNPSPPNTALRSVP